MSKKFRLLIGAAALSLSACTPGAAPGSVQPGGPGVQVAPAAPKVLTIAIRQEAATIEGFTGEGGSSGGAGEVKFMVHGHLAVRDSVDAVRPQLAVELPSIEKGTWRVGADGTMDTTWKLHPGVKWHDGAPFTSNDMLFTLRVYKDTDLAHAERAHTNRMLSAEAPDPFTFVVHWSAIDVEADRADGLSPVPRHLLEELYQSDKSAFAISPRFTTEFVGLGPYRLTRWERAVEMDLSRFDEYWEGRPPLDRIIMRFIGDPNTMVANVLSGSIDLLLPPSVSVDSALELRRRWTGTGNQVRTDISPFVIYHEIQYAPDRARPTNGFTNRTVREALYEAIDRKGLVDGVSQGIAPVADSWYRPDDPLRPQLQSAIPSFPYDPRRAQMLLSEAGWNRGGDGVLVNGQTGERFETVLWSIVRVGGERPASVVADYWKTVGLDTTINAVPPSLTQDREYHTTFPGALLTASGIGESGFTPRLDSRDVATAANRFGGRNRGSYSNPRADALRDQLAMTVDPVARIPIMRQQLQEILGDVAVMPLWWEVAVIVALADVKADIAPSNPGWNAFTWDKV